MAAKVPQPVTSDPVAVANRLRPILLKLARHLRREPHDLGVTGGQASLLVAVRRNPGIGVGELAALEGVSAPAMSGHVKRLERGGLVARVTGDDRRRVGLAITDEGHRVLRSVRSRRTAWLAARLRELDARELEALDGAIPALEALLEADE